MTNPARSNPTPSGAQARSIDVWTRADRFARIVIVGSVLAVLAVAAMAPMRDVLIRLIHDDAFYYFEIARRMARGEGSTFDGIDRTNGYHPLWLFLLLPLAPVMEASRELGIRLIVSLSALLMGGALWLLHGTARRLAPRYGALAPLFAFAALTFSSLYGMESPLAALLLSLLLWLVGRGGVVREWKAGLIIGLVAGALVLSRLDSAVYVAALDAVWAAHLWAKRRASSEESGWGAWICCVLAQAMLVLPYLASNLVYFGHVLTVSALVKSGRQGGLSLIWARSRLALLAIASLGSGILAVWWKRKDEGQMVLHTAALGTLLALCVNGLKGGYETFDWYFTLPVLCGGLFLAVGIEALIAQGISGRLLRGAVSIGLVIVLAATLNGKRKPSAFEEQFNRGVWIAAHAPKEAVFAEPDCGILGYMSERPFLNTDGLTNSFVFQRALTEDRLPAWFMAAGFNAYALPRDYQPRLGSDGRYRQELVLRKGMTGEQRECTSIVVPWPGATEGGDYRLWRVLSVERGAP